MSEDAGCFSVSVRGRVQVAHSFAGEAFGSAQALHGVTYTIDAVLTGPALAPSVNYLIDICEAERALHQALDAYDKRNLDEVAEFAGQNTTCERMAQAVHERMAASIAGAAPLLTTLKVVVRESDVAFVEYERKLALDAPPGVYTVSVRTRFMAARSLRGSRFGEAEQRLHGATFIIDAQFSGRTLMPEMTFLLDICLAEKLLAGAVERLHQTNLDDSLGDVNPTGGAIAEVIGEVLAHGLAEQQLESLRLVVRESDQVVSEHVRAIGVGGGSAPVVPSHTLVSRGRCMIAHSFSGAAFGEAAALHGCTYVVDAKLSGPALAGDGGFPIERAELLRALEQALAVYDRHNLDEVCAT